MRVIGLFLAGVLASAPSIVAHAVPLGLDTEQLGTKRAAGFIEVAGLCGWGWYPVPGHWSQWRGVWVPPHCAPNRYYGAWAPYGGWGGPYGSWEAPYGGWRPYGDWQGSDEGWHDTGDDS
jgi:hypothetical protein